MSDENTVKLPPMSETRWMFYEPLSGTNTIGLYHGADSGHVIVYHNSRVMIIDFLITKSKTYSLYVNDYLVKLNITRDRQDFDYTMDIVPPERAINPMERFVLSVGDYFKKAFA